MSGALRRALILVAAMVQLALTALPPAHAQQALDEAKVKAAFLLRFMQYV